MLRVVTDAYDLNSSPDRDQSPATTGLPAGAPWAVQAPSEVSNPSTAWSAPPTETRASSANTPRPPAPPSETYERETSTVLPAYALRSKETCFQPSDEPVKLFHEPLVPWAAQPRCRG